MEMARADQEDIDRVVEFLQIVEEYFEYETHTPRSGDSEGEPKEISEEEFVRLLREKWGHRFGPALVDAAWMRVVFGYQVLVDNVCDKESDVLAMRKDWKEIIDKVQQESLNGDSEPAIADLALLVVRLIRQVRKHDAVNDVAAKAMDYLRRKNLSPSVVREMKGGA